MKEARAATGIQELPTPFTRTWSIWNPIIPVSYTHLHATIGLGVAKVLMSIKDSLHGTMKLIFQPAEEGVRGAKSIVENGHLDGVDYLIGSHVSDKAADDPAVDVYKRQDP